MNIAKRRKKKSERIKLTQAWDKAINSNLLILCLQKDWDKIRPCNTPTQPPPTNTPNHNPAYINIFHLANHIICSIHRLCMSCCTVTLSLCVCVICTHTLRFSCFLNYYYHYFHHYWCWHNKLHSQNLIYRIFVLFCTQNFRVFQNSQNDHIIIAL